MRWADTLGWTVRGLPQQGVDDSTSAGKAEVEMRSMPGEFGQFGERRAVAHGLGCDTIVFGHLAILRKALSRGPSGSLNAPPRAGVIDRARGNTGC